MNHLLKTKTSFKCRSLFKITILQKWSNNFLGSKQHKYYFHIHQWHYSNSKPTSSIYCNEYVIVSTQKSLININKNWAWKSFCHCDRFSTSNILIFCVVHFWSSVNWLGTRARQCERRIYGAVVVFLHVHMGWALEGIIIQWFQSCMGNRNVCLRETRDFGGRGEDHCIPHGQSIPRYVVFW